MWTHKQFNEFISVVAEVNPILPTARDNMIPLDPHGGSSRSFVHAPARAKSSTEHRHSHLTSTTWQFPLSLNRKAGTRVQARYQMMQPILDLLLGRRRDLRWAQSKRTRKRDHHLND